jgi:metal-responsive CopG/Arc/MetJ family transcriptional regulator
MPRKPAPRPIDRPETKVFTFVLPMTLIAEIDAIAGEERRSRVKMVEVALEDFVRDYRRSREDVA